MTDFEGRMAVLRDRFLERCRSDSVFLANFAGHNRDEVIATVHRLSGSAGMFGFADLSLAAEQAEDCLREQADAGSSMAKVVLELQKIQEV